MIVADEVLEPGGECSACHEHADERVIIAMSQGGSGPGGPARKACLPCARVRAHSAVAPKWLVEDLAVIDAERLRPLVVAVGPRAALQPCRD